MEKAKENNFGVKIPVRCKFWERDTSSIEDVPLDSVSLSHPDPDPDSDVEDPLSDSLESLSYSESESQLVPLDPSSDPDSLVLGCLAAAALAGFKRDFALTSLLEGLGFGGMFGLGEGFESMLTSAL